MMHTIRSGTIRWQIHDFLYNGNSLLYLSPFARYSQKKEKFQIFDLGNKGQGVAKWNLCHSTADVRIHIVDSFPKFSYM